MKASTPIGLQGLFWYFPTSARDKKWGIYVTTVGKTHVAARKPYPPAGHPGAYDYTWDGGRVLSVHAVIYISRGRGWIDFGPDRRRQTVQAGHVIILFPGLWHRYRPDPAVGWDENWVAFDGEIARRWIDECGFTPGQPILKARNEETLLGMFTRLIEIGQESPVAFQQLMCAQVHGILARLYSDEQKALGGGDLATAIVMDAQARMQKAFTKDLDVQALAREAKVGYSWFRHAFVRQTGFSPHQYILELRLARARDLLVNSKMKIKQIAVSCGFDDEHYFSRIFAAKTGMTALEWRVQAQQKSVN
jgi:AraC-like DNA-binding protein